MQDPVQKDLLGKEIFKITPCNCSSETTKRQSIHRCIWWVLMMGMEEPFSTLLDFISDASSVRLN